jgi:hypothetical protein
VRGRFSELEYSIKCAAAPRVYERVLHTVFERRRREQIKSLGGRRTEAQAANPVALSVLKTLCHWHVNQQPLDAFLD